MPLRTHTSKPAGVSPHSAAACGRVRVIAWLSDEVRRFPKVIASKLAASLEVFFGVRNHMRGHS